MCYLKKLPTSLKTLIVLSVVALFVFLNVYFSLSNADYLAILSYGYMCEKGWGGHDSPHRELLYTWKFLEPLLFGLVGASINFSLINSEMIVQGIYMTFIGFGVRLVGTFLLMTLTRRYTLKERIFMAFSNIPRSSV